MIWSLLEAERTLIDVWRRPKTSRLTHLYHSTINFAVVHNAAFPPWRRHVMPWSSGPACNTRATMISFKGRRNRIDDARRKRSGHDLRRQRKRPCRERHQRLTRSAPPINGIDALLQSP